MNLPLLLAAVGDISGKGEGARYLQYLKDPILVVLAVLPLAVGFFIWAKASSRKRRRHHRHRHRITAEESQALVESWKTMRNSRRRRKHRHHQEPTNPTLAETGGLPPRRKPKPEDPASDLPPPPTTVPPIQRQSDGSVPPNPLTD
jgi:hypothetical protein